MGRVLFTIFGLTRLRKDVLCGTRRPASRAPPRIALPLCGEDGGLPPSPGSGKTLVMPVANDALMDRALELGFELQAYSCVSSLDEMAEAEAPAAGGAGGECR